MEGRSRPDIQAIVDKATKIAAEYTPEQRMRMQVILNQNDYMNAGTFAGKQGANHLLYKYGLTKTQTLALLVVQYGICGICTANLLGVKWVVDHNHKTGLVRGILCYACNTGLGKLGGDMEGLKRADRYLRANGEG